MSASTTVFDALIPPLRQALKEEKYEEPTPIQAGALPAVLEGRDVVGTAQTGTGKTAAFVLPMLHRLIENPGKKGLRGLILAPTRELAEQIGESLGRYGRHTSVGYTVIYGGVSQVRQEKALRKGPQILVACPGRLLDLMNQGLVKLDRVDTFVLDEMDRMLDMGFLPDIKRVLQKVPSSRQTLFFSATMSKRIEQVASTMVKDPVRVAVDPGEPAVSRIEQRVMFVDKGNKSRLLLQELEAIRGGSALVFVQMKHNADRIVKDLNRAGIDSAALHGNKSQSARLRALNAFRSAKIQVLVATDVAARGIDIDEIALVVNYDMPVEAETYVHRIGRTARAGATGLAVSFCSPQDRAYLGPIEKLLGEPVPVDRDHEFHSQAAEHSKEKPRVPGQGRRGDHPKNRNRTQPSKRRGRRH